jgi:hypothetical protein
MNSAPEDSREDFRDLFDLEEVLRDGFRIVVEED